MDKSGTRQEDTMNARLLSVILSSALLASVFVVLEAHSGQTSTKAATTPSTSWKAVDDAMGRQGQEQPDGAHKYSMPRSDLKVTLDGVELKAGFALGSWTAFQRMGAQADVMGDLVLADTEIAPVMQKLSDSGI